MKTYNSGIVNIIMSMLHYKKTFFFSFKSVIVSNLLT